MLSRQTTLKAQASPRIEKSDMMKEVAAKTSFWQVMRSDYWRKREQQAASPVDISPPGSPETVDGKRGTLVPDAKRSTLVADLKRGTLKSEPRKSSITSLPPRTPEVRTGRRPRENSPPPQSPAQRRDFQNLKGFRSSNSTGQLPRVLCRPAKLLSIEGAVNVLKDSGMWEDLPSPQATRVLSRASSAASLPPLAHKVGEANGGISPVNDEHSCGSEAPLSPEAVFPHLANRKTMAPRRLIFVDSDSSGNTQKLKEVLEIVSSNPMPDSDGIDSRRNSRNFSGQDLEMFSQYWEGSSACSGSTSRLKNARNDMMDLTFKHPPRWVRSSSVYDKLDPSGFFKCMGPQPFPRVDADAQQFDETAELAYLTAYEDSRLMPRVPRSVTNAIMEARSMEEPESADGPTSGQSSAPLHRLDIVNYGVGDAALKALSESLRHLGRLESLNLAGNKLKGSTVAEFLRVQLLPHGSALKELDLSGNRELGAAAMDALTDLLRKGDLRVLQALHLNSINVPDEKWDPLLNEITETGSVRTLSAADTRIGFRSQAPYTALARLMSRGSLLRLDISGNFLRYEGCEKLGRALAESDSLIDLDLSHNAGDPLDVTPADKELKNPANFAPLLYICEGLSRNTVLQNVGLAHCSLGYAADFLLGEAISRHPSLKRVDVSSNPHGGLGLACLVRALGQPQSKLQLLDVSDSRTGSAPAPAIPYAWAEPSGPYALRLVNPQHRAVLRALVGRPTISGKTSLDCFKEVKAVGQEKGWGIASCSSLDYYGMPTVPLTGSVSFTYTAAVPGTPRGDTNPLAKMQDWHKLGKIPLRFQRSAALMASYRTCRTDEQRGFFLDAVSSTFLLKNAHLELFARHSSPTLDLRRIVRGIFHTLAESALCAPTHTRQPTLWELGAEPKVRADAAQALFFNLRSPTGRYNLGLASPSDRACAARLQALCAFERKLSMAQGRPDVSQLGTHEPVRNFRLGHEFSNFSLPACGNLQLDYVSTAFPPRGAAPAASAPGLVAGLLAALRHSRAPWLESILALRTVVDRLSLSAADVAAFVEAAAKLPGQPSSKPARVEALITCFGRCFERSKLTTAAVMHNPSVFSEEDANQLRARLGRANVLDAENIEKEATNLPSGNEFKLDLAVHEDRQVALYLTGVAKRESPDFLTNCALSKGTWKADLINSENFPPEGTFSCKYVASDPQVVSQAGRKEVAQKVLGLVL